MAGKSDKSLGPATLADLVTYLDKRIDESVAKGTQAALAALGQVTEFPPPQRAVKVPATATAKNGKNGKSKSPRGAEGQAWAQARYAGATACEEAFKACKTPADVKRVMLEHVTGENGLGWGVMCRMFAKGKTASEALGLD